MNNHPPSSKLVMLGVGQTALQVAKLASQYKLLGTTRDANKSETLKSAGIVTLVIQPNFSDQQKEELADHIKGSKVLVSFPPDSHSDSLFASYAVMPTL